MKSKTMFRLRPEHSREWFRVRIYPTPAVAMFSCVLLLFLGVVAAHLIKWGLVNAVWGLPVLGDGRADLEACKAPAAGACWAVVVQRYRFILFGYYPYAEQWRPLLASLILLAVCATSALPSQWRPRTLLMWCLAVPVCLGLMNGGVLGLVRVNQSQWGGLPLVLMMATAALVTAAPLGLLVALGRLQTSPPLIRAACATFVEFSRGIPLVTVLLVSSLMVPMLLPASWNVPNLVRAEVALGIFMTAYLAEVFRSGIQSVPTAQFEAADSLALPPFIKYSRVVIPQALSISVPGIVNNTIGLFKNTSILSIIGMADITSASQIVLSDPSFSSFYIEIYAFTSLIYAVFCLMISKYGRFIERKLDEKRRH